MSKCVYLASMGVKIEQTVGVQNKECFFFFFFFFQNAYLMVMSTETLATTKTAKTYALVRRNLMIYSTVQANLYTLVG